MTPMQAARLKVWQRRWERSAAARRKAREGAWWSTERALFAAATAAEQRRPSEWLTRMSAFLTAGRRPVLDAAGNKILGSEGNRAERRRNGLVTYRPAVQVPERIVEAALSKTERRRRRLAAAEAR